MLYSKLLRPLLFAMTKDDPEIAHERVLHLLSLPERSRYVRGVLSELTDIESSRLDQNVFGLRFPNPVGLAAGFDKDGVALHALAALGFGFIEMGTVTYHPQEGNPRPRMFRLVQDRALLNAMGFNNAGAVATAARLSEAKKLPVPLGISIGKSKVAHLRYAVDDYVASLKLLYRFADYIAVNVSSPNTPGLRSLQDKELLEELLVELIHVAVSLSSEQGRLHRKPIIVKIAPDLSNEAIIELVQLLLKLEIDGVVATNTTTERRWLRSPIPEEWMGKGGLSGAPLFGRAHAVVQLISKVTEGKLPIIAVGGIESIHEASAMFDAGASLLQVYTPFIYQGPRFPSKMNREIDRWLREQGTDLRSLSSSRN